MKKLIKLFSCLFVVFLVVFLVNFLQMFVALSALSSDSIPGSSGGNTPPGWPSTAQEPQSATVR